MHRRYKKRGEEKAFIAHVMTTVNNMEMKHHK